MPRPKLKPTEESRQLAKHLAAVGIPQEQIALKLGIRSPKTLRKHYRPELDLGAIEANANVGGALYKNAMAGNVEAQKFWMLHKAGWGRHIHHAAPTAPPPFVVPQEEKEAA